MKMYDERQVPARPRGPDGRFLVKIMVCGRFRPAPPPPPGGGELGEQNDSKHRSELELGGKTCLGIGSPPQGLEFLRNFQPLGPDSGPGGRTARLGALCVNTIPAGRCRTAKCHETVLELVSRATGS